MSDDPTKLRRMLKELEAIRELAEKLIIPLDRSILPADAMISAAILGAALQSYREKNDEGSDTIRKGD